LFEIVKTQHEVFSVDIDLAAPLNRCDIMHICFPFRDEKFVGEVVYQPALPIVNSTVAPGTSRSIADESGMAVVNSPVRGKHGRMREEILRYTKFIGAKVRSNVLKQENLSAEGWRDIEGASVGSPTPRPSNPA
jgi:hypothetical protein